MRCVPAPRLCAARRLLRRRDTLAMVYVRATLCEFSRQLMLIADLLIRASFMPLRCCVAYLPCYFADTPHCAISATPDAAAIAAAICRHTPLCRYFAFIFAMLISCALLPLDFFSDAADSLRLLLRGDAC